MTIIYLSIALLLLAIVILLAKINKALIYIHSQLRKLNKEYAIPHHNKCPCMKDVYCVECHNMED